MEYSVGRAVEESRTYQHSLTTVFEKVTTSTSVLFTHEQEAGRYT